jgi:rhodanese-related sulfurtransferase
MKKIFNLTLLMAIVSSVILTGCKDDDPATPERQTDAEFQTLATYLQAQSLDLSNILDGWIITAADVNASPDDFYVIDIRTKDGDSDGENDYEEGHIPGAVNSTLGEILTTAENAGSKTIVVVCYSGQTAGHAVVALRLSGYPTAKVLKWGMSGWHTTLDSWSGACNTITSANWIDAPGSIAEGTTEYDDPDITETGDGAAILEARVASLLSGGLRGVTGADVLDAPGSYYINNFWDAADVEHYGNISGAKRIKPLTLTGEEYKYLDPSKEVVTYCWTGQTSSMVTAYLYVLGYNSLSLKNGVNSMIYDNLESHKWSADAISDLTLE